MKILTPGNLAANPANYSGKKVTVRAGIEDVLGPQVFLLDEDRLFAWPDVLVITPALSNAETARDGPAPPNAWADTERSRASLWIRALRGNAVGADGCRRRDDVLRSGPELLFDANEFSQHGGSKSQRRIGVAARRVIIAPLPRN